MAAARSGFSDLERLLTELCGTGPLPIAKLQALSEAQWDELARRAADYRLEPLLFVERANGPWGGVFPGAVVARWRESRRRSALLSLVQRRELDKASGLLADRGIVPIALKGAWLAWHVYPEPAMRPLRDLDLLVAPDEALASWDALLAAGYVRPDDDRMPIEEWASRFKHLPPLVSPAGTVVELHTALWDKERAPPLLTGCAARTVPSEREGAFRFLAAEDMFAHLCVHALYGHRLDAGPLLLVDIDFLVASVALDWPALWQRAEREGWARPAALMLALTDRWRRPGILAASGCPIAVPADLVNAAPFLLCKPLAAREEDQVSAKASRRDISLGEKIRRIADRRRRFATTYRYLRWMATQARDRAGAISSAAGRSRGAAIGALDRWLQYRGCEATGEDGPAAPEPN